MYSTDFGEDYQTLSKSKRKSGDQRALEELSYELKRCIESMGIIEDILEMFEQGIEVISNASFDTGGFVKKGYDAELDDLYHKKKSIENKVEELKQQYSDIPKLNISEIRYNDLIGLHIKVSKAKSIYITYDFKKVQELANYILYSNSDLDELSKSLVTLNHRILKKERMIFNEFVELVAINSEMLSNVAGAIAVIDLSCSMAQFAVRRGHTKPEFVTERTFEITNGRHILLERILDKVQSNSCILSTSEPVMMVTGPNMSGKTTYLKQNALIALMAHVGLFVPAEKAVMSVFDSLFVRVRDHDNLAAGMSTFMVEITELATTLISAKNTSLILIDEIGRGTNNKEGEAMTCAILDHLNKSSIFTIITTHYTNISQVVTGLQEVQMVVQLNPTLVFTHKVSPGRSDQAYSVAVGQIGGLPESILQQAQYNQTVIRDSTI